MQLITQQINPGEEIDIQRAGQKFLLNSCGIADALDVSLTRKGSPFFIAPGMRRGFKAMPLGGFDGIRLKNTTAAATIASFFALLDGDGDIAISDNITISNGGTPLTVTFPPGLTLGAVNVTNFPAVQVAHVDNFPAVQTVAVNNLPAVQTVAVNNLPAVQVAHVDNFPADPANNGAFTNAQKTVTNISAQLVAANAARRYLLIQNNDTAGIVYVRVDGTAVVTGFGIKIAPGASYELQGFVPTGAIHAGGSIASNANVVVVEG